jgi:hypothetical protein
LWLVGLWPPEKLKASIEKCFYQWMWSLCLGSVFISECGVCVISEVWMLGKLHLPLKGKSCLMMMKKMI